MSRRAVTLGRSIRCGGWESLVGDAGARFPPGERIPWRPDLDRGDSQVGGEPIGPENRPEGAVSEGAAPTEKVCPICRRTDGEWPGPTICGWP